MMRRFSLVWALVAVVLVVGFAFAQESFSVRVVRDANLRAGPGTTFAIVGSAKAGDLLTVVESNGDRSWHRVGTGRWIAAFLVERVNPSAAATSTQGQAGRTAATVTNIVDGDTIDVTINGASYRVRYILVNTPETNQTFGSEATAKNRELVAGKTVYLEKDVSETDRYGRLLRYVYLADGTMVNRELVRLGFAQLATFPPDVKHEAVIRAAQQEAVAAGRGLWAASSAPAAVSPTATPRPAVVAPPAGQSRGNCDASYPDVCIPPRPPDLDCGDISHRRFRVLQPDPHGFDRDKDGVGCES